MKNAPEIKINSWSFLNQAIDNPILLRTKIFQTYGDIAWKKLGGNKTYYFSHPMYVQHILDTKQDNFIYRHPALQNAFINFLGPNSIILSNDLAQWYRDRLIAKMSFEGKVYFKEYSETIISLCDEMLRGWESKYKDGQLFNFEEEIDTLIIGIVIHTLFVHFDLLNANELAKLVPLSTESVKKKLKFILKPLWYFSSSRRTYQQAVDYLRTLSCDIVSQRLKQNKEWDDMLGHFIHQYQHFSKEELVKNLGSHVATFLIVGYFTTASLIHWLITILSQQPEIEAKICKESNMVIGNRFPKLEDLHSIPFQSAVIKEVLRMYPSNHTIMRQALEENVINGFYIPKKAGIILSIPHIQRHIDFWENPDGFNPERFIKDPLGQTNPYAYIPFGLGKRNCIASAFSTMEAQIITTMILQRFSIYLPPHTDVKPFTTTLLNNRPNVKMMYIKKKSVT